MKRHGRTLLAIASLVFGTTLTAHAQTDEPDPGSSDEPADSAGEGTWTDEVAPPAEPAPAPAPEPAPEAPAIPEAPPAAGDRPGLVLTGSFFSRYELRENYDSIGAVGPRLGEGDAMFYRARLGLATTPIDIGEGRSVTLITAPQAAGIWGPSGGLADATAGFHEAKMRIAGATNWLELGRFEMAYADHLVIGDVGWHETGRSFDGARLHLGLGDNGAWVDAFLTMINEGATLGGLTGFTEGDIYFAGAYAGLGPNFDSTMDLDAYLLAHIVPSIDMVQDYTAVEVTLGSRVKKTMNDLTVRAEGGLQVGKRPGADVSVFAFQLDADATYAMSDTLKLIFGGVYASGDDLDSETDEGWNQLYPTAHKFLGLMDIMGARNNVVDGYAKARLDHSDKIGYGADAHLFLRPQTPDGVDSYTGIEGDFWALYQIGKGLGLRTQYAAFVPNGDGPLGNDELIHYVEIQLAFTLK